MRKTLFRAGQVIENAAGRFTVPEQWWLNKSGADQKTQKKSAKKKKAKKG